MLSGKCQYGQRNNVIYIDSDGNEQVYQCKHESISEASKLCIFHLDGYWADDLNKAEKVRNEFFMELKKAKSTGEELKCVSYILPHITIKGELNIPVNFNRTVFHGGDFSNVTFKKTADFSGSKFKQKAKFDSATFEQDAKFSDTHFAVDSSFEDVTFHQKADFSNMEFNASTNFVNAKFNKEARFEGAIFHQKADFSNATIHRAQFYKTRFGNEVKFEDASFQENAVFDSVRFDMKAKFNESSFQKHAYFRNTSFSDIEYRGTTFMGKTYFRKSQFKESADFTLAMFENDVDFISSKFEGVSEFNLVSFQCSFFYNVKFLESVNFHTTKFNRKTDFRYAEFHDETWFKDVVFIQQENEEIMSEIAQGKEFVIFRRVNFKYPEKIVFETCNFKYVSFIHTDLTRVKFRDPTWPTPTDWKSDSFIGKIKSVFGKQDSYLLCDEWLFKLKNSGIETKYSEDLTTGNILAIYRMLRENFEYNVDYEDAGRFFVGEMDVKRQNTDSRADKFILLLYKILSLYGQSYVRPLLFLVVLIIGFSFLRVGLDLFLPAILSNNNFLTSLWRSVAVSSQFRGTEPVDILQWILSIPLLVLFGLALRRRFERRFRH